MVDAGRRVMVVCLLASSEEEEEEGERLSMQGVVL